MKKYKKYKNYTSYFLIFSLVINLILGAFIINLLYNDVPTAEAFSEINDAGTYGPKGIETIEGDATISTADVTLQNTIITGDLYLKEEIGEGSVHLANVTVAGTTFISGGGENSIILEDTSLNNVVINKKGSKVRVVTIGNTTINFTSVEGPALLEEERLAGDAQGFTGVSIKTEEEVILSGDFAAINIVMENAQVTIAKGLALKVHIEKTARNSVLKTFKGTEVADLEINAPSELTGEGLVKEILVKTPGLTKLSGSIDNITTEGIGVYIQISQGTVKNFIVLENESATSIHLNEDATINNMELLGNAGVTGQGLIKLVSINYPGITIDTKEKPEKIEISGDLTAMIGGAEYPEEEEKTTPPKDSNSETGSTTNPSPTPSPKPDPKPDSTPDPTPQPKPSSISINSTGSMTLLSGEKGQRTITSYSPSDANISVSSSNNNVASVSRSGNTITVTGKGAGPAKITVTVSKSGHNSSSTSFDVSVVGVKIKDISSPIPGITRLEIELSNTSSPNNFKVSMYGNSFNYENGYFWWGFASSDIAGKSEAELKNAAVLTKK